MTNKPFSKPFLIVERTFDISTHSSKESILGEYTDPGLLKDDLFKFMKEKPNSDVRVIPK